VGLKLYQKFLSVEIGRSTMYVKLKMAHFGALQAVMLFWKTMTAKFVSMGFVVIQHRMKTLHHSVSHGGYKGV